MLRGQGVVELARADARLGLAEAIHPGQHYRRRVAGAADAALAFVVGIARAVEDATDDGDGAASAVPAEGVGRDVPKFFLMSVL